jgi:calcium-dependent protein kinase
MVMGSRQLVEVLHCDERLWREAWLWCSLEEAEGGERKSPDEILNLVFRKEEMAVTSDWKLEWDSERGEVKVSKKGSDWAFKLAFNSGVGTCHCEEVEGQMLPPTDEFDVSLFVQLVNEKQRTIMQVLRNMLSKAKFELQFGNSAYKRKEKSSTAAIGHAMLRGDSIGLSRRATEREEPSSAAKYSRKMSYDALQMMLMKDDEESVDEEMCNLVNDLLRVDDRDRHRKRQSQDEFISAGRRGSTGHIQPLTSANFDAKDLEAWYLANMGNDVSNDDKLQWIHSRRKRMDERQNHKTLDVSTRSNVSAYSMFSAGMLEDLEDYIEGLCDESDAENSFGTRRGDLTSEASPESPRDKQMNEDLISPKSASYSKDSEVSSIHTEEKKADEQSAYITGVFRDVATKYEVSDIVVGSGGFGEVRECTDKKSGQTHVVKTIHKPPLDDTSKVNLIRNEILLLHEAKHPNIVELKDLFEDSKCVHIVMEKCTGGDLFDRVVNENPARIRHRAEAIKHETRTANTMRAIMQVIKYLHSKGIVHRDIKPEHFLLTTDRKESQRIKLIDFGLARKHKKGSPPMTTFTGSPSFVAPEVIARSYDHMCDLFSTGVTAYFLLTGMLPFDGPSDEDTFDLISMGEFRFPSSSIHLSDDARNFITKLLRTDPNKRMTAEEALNHPWLKEDASC